MNSSAPVRGLIFDFDGLMVDTETAIYQAWHELYQEHGHPLTIETWAQCVGSDFGHYDPAVELERLIQRTLPWESITQRRRQRVTELLQHQDTLPGVRELLQQACDHSIPCAVASSSSSNWVNGWLQKLDLLSFFQNVTTLDDVGRAKPDPGLFLHASSQLGLPPADLLVIEDSQNGLRAATAAGMRCLIVAGEITRHLGFAQAWQQRQSLQGFNLESII
ncbi:HAD family phosphatase [Phragmitibacter flavus]|uniref:HAD family phosphatase n=1 Tax=Phragmitibacter flavus TaxID=2576071 RepID=A0A5R8KBQ0_9BACT|nr:HAD family phosphatase [Phragmitibacter flavus]TLD69355.1 HAD family phosphatase [Phragmitibacter flavus]